MLPLLLLSLSACGTDLRCGPGTRAVDGVCTPSPQATADIDTAAPTDTADTAPPPALLAEAFDTLDGARWLPGSWTLGATTLSAAQVSVTDGVLTIAHQAGGPGWLGGEVYTTETFGHAEWTARIAAPSASGTVCALFLYAAVEVGSTWITNEIDIELLGGQVWLSTYSQWRPEDGYDAGPTHRSIIWAAPAGFDTADWHDYTIRYAPDGVSFSVDGVDAGSITDAIPLGAMAMHINHWTSTTWPEVGTPPAGEVLTCRVDHLEGRSL